MFQRGTLLAFPGSPRPHSLEIVDKTLLSTARTPAGNGVGSPGEHKP